MNVTKPSAGDDILFVLKLPPPFGGGERAHLYIYEELREKYRFLTFSRRRHSKAAQGKLKLANIIFGLKMMFLVSAACLQKRPKVVFLWLPKDLPAFLRTCALVWFLRTLDIKVIGDLHGMGFSFLNSNRLQQFYVKHINKFFAIRTLSLSISNDLRTSGFNNIIFPIDNGVRAPQSALQSQPDIAAPLQLLYLGAISEAKGFLETLNVLRLLQEQHRPVYLTVVGEWTSTEFQHSAEAVIEENGLSSFIEFTGILEGNDKWRAIGRSHFLLHFSRWDGQPLTIIEAMAAGVPSLAFQVGAIPEMIQDGRNGFLVENAAQAAEILLQALDGLVNYRQVATTARRTFKQRFTIQRYIENIEKLVMVNDNVASDAISKNR